MFTVDDLTPNAKAALGRAYRHADRREKCSRRDFSGGWLAALEWLGSRSSFKPEAWQREHPPKEG